MEISDIKHSSHPMNKGNDYGNDMIYHSIKILGLGRGIVVDKNNVVISGEKVLSQCEKIGIKKIQVVETTGDTLVVVKRIDIENSDKIGLQLSLVDNLSCLENIEWDAENVENNMLANLSFNPKDWGADACCVKDLKIETLLNNDRINTKNANPKKFKHPIQLSLFEEYE